MLCNTYTNVFSNITHKNDRKGVDESFYQVWYQLDYNWMSYKGSK